MVCRNFLELFDTIENGQTNADISSVVQMWDMLLRIGVDNTIGGIFDTLDVFDFSLYNKRKKNLDCCGLDTRGSGYFSCAIEPIIISCIEF